MRSCQSKVLNIYDKPIGIEIATRCIRNVTWDNYRDGVTLLLIRDS